MKRSYRSPDAKCRADLAGLCQAERRVDSSRCSRAKVGQRSRPTFAMNQGGWKEALLPVIRRPAKGWNAALIQRTSACYTALEIARRYGRVGQHKEAKDAVTH
jgi:hypothetical protein